MRILSILSIFSVAAEFCNLKAHRFAVDERFGVL
jgi:hypothetical protein